MTDIHLHSSFSCDGTDSPESMILTAIEKKLKFIGFAEHYNFDCDIIGLDEKSCDSKKYIKELNRLKEKYQDKITVLCGMEFGFTTSEKHNLLYKKEYDTFIPDFVVNSVHTPSFLQAEKQNGKITLHYNYDKQTIYSNYLKLVYQSLFVPYHYDIISHLGYVTRYAPYIDKTMSLKEFKKDLDLILQTIIEKNKILEVNTNINFTFAQASPTTDILTRYYELGGRNISFASDAHFKARIAEKRNLVVDILSKIGFTHFTIPTKNGYIKFDF